MVKSLHKDLEDHINEVVTQLSKYLSSDDAKTRFVSWNSKELPPAGKSWKETEEKIKLFLANRFKEIIEKCEEDERVFDNAYKSFLQHIQQHFISDVVKLAGLQHSRTKHDPEGSNKASSWMKSVAGTVSPVAAGVAGIASLKLAAANPVGAAAMAVAAVVFTSATLLKAKFDDNKLDKYKINRQAFMKEMSTQFLADAAQTNNVKTLVKDILGGLKDNLAKIKARLPQLIEADKKLYEDLQAETPPPPPRCLVPSLPADKG